MNHEQAFLADIRENPHDDAPRLIFADWLEDEGQSERAEFIRSQVASDRLDVYDPDLFARNQREKEIQSQHQKKWLGRLRGGLQEYTFRRGLLDEVSLRVESLLKHANSLARHPIRTLKLRFEPGDVDRADQVANCPAFQCVETLILAQTSRLTATSVGQLCNSPYLSSLRHLVLSDVGIQAEAVAAIVFSPLAGQLQSLDLANNTIGPGGIESIIHPEKLTRLQRLRINSTSIGNAGIDTLCAGKWLPPLQSLDLGELRLDARAVRTLAGCRRLAGLRRLNLAGSSMGDDGAIALARSKYIRNLETLELRSNRIGRSGIEAMTANGFLDSIEYICLSGNSVGEVGIRSLVKTKPTNLQFLLFGTAKLDDQAMALLAEWPALANVRELNLYHNDLTAFGLRWLFDSPHLQNLCRMNLEQNTLGDLGAQVLANWPGLANMRWLKLRANDISAEGALSLARSPHLRNMTELDLSANDDLGEVVRQAFTTGEVRQHVRRVAPWDVEQVNYYPPYSEWRPRG